MWINLCVIFSWCISAYVDCDMSVDGSDGNEVEETVVSPATTAQPELPTVREILPMTNEMTDSRNPGPAGRSSCAH